MRNNNIKIKYKTFLNLSSKESKGLDNYIFNNAKQLKNDAILLYKNKSYSTAASLLVLSIEEIIKANTVLLHSQGYDVYKFKSSKKIFANHIFRHKIMKYINIRLSVVDMFSVYYRNSSKITGIIWFDKIINDIHIFVEISNSSMKLIKSNFEIDKFNDYKNKGFYVDYKDKILIPKEQITIDDYQNILNISDDILNAYKLLRIIFHPKVTNHIKEEELKLFKKFLKDSIKNGLE